MQEKRENGMTKQNDTQETKIGCGNLNVQNNFTSIVLNLFTARWY